ncbi:hypothetical protein LIER_40083 [Lithospermum erythrorhizon]|uniref:Uncharacterized protein n=1 Tax=Lithospermum erythrorhizon TaxID=34254 RepID=A0AAV3QSH5_LITER
MFPGRNQEADTLSHLATAGYETLPEATMVEWAEEEERYVTREVGLMALEQGHGGMYGSHINARALT